MRIERVSFIVVLATLARSAWGEPLAASLADRPLTLPAATLEVEARLAYHARRALGVDVLSAETMDLGLRAGISARWELGATLPMQLHPDPASSRELILAAAWRAYVGGRLEMAPSIVVPVTVRRGYDVVPEVVFGAQLRDRLGPRLFAVAGRRLIRIDVRPAIAVGAVLEGGLGVQATDALAVVLEARLAEVTLAGQIDRTATVIDALPAALSALLAVSGWLDVTLEARADVLQPGDDYVVALGVLGRN